MTHRRFEAGLKCFPAAQRPQHAPIIPPSPIIKAGYSCLGEIPRSFLWLYKMIFTHLTSVHDHFDYCLAKYLNTDGSGKWEKLDPWGTPPLPRYRHTAIFDEASRSMIVFGGATAPNLYDPPIILNDVCHYHVGKLILTFTRYPGTIR